MFKSEKKRKIRKSLISWKLLIKFKNILVCESNSGQLYKLLMAEYMLPMKKFTKIRGKPFSKLEIIKVVQEKLTNINLVEV